MLLRILTIAAILATFAFLAPHASAAPLDQRAGNGVHVGVGNNHPVNVTVINRGFRHPFGFGFRGFGPGFGFVPPPLLLPPPVVPVAVPVPVSVPVAVPQVAYPPALAAPSCGCPQ